MLKYDCSYKWGIYYIGGSNMYTNIDSLRGIWEWIIGPRP